jgi:hypothetical protein
LPPPPTPVSVTARPFDFEHHGSHTGKILIASDERLFWAGRLC